MPKTKAAPLPVKQRPPGVADDWIDPDCKFASDAELQFAQLWVTLYPDYDLHTHFQFAPPRKFEFDFCHFPSKVAIEIQGGIHTQGGHSTGKGIQSDYEKMRLAAENGWIILPLSTFDSQNIEALSGVVKTIEGRMK